jgi:MFS transporter, OFA family, oxalate/formate antiporter
MNAAVSEHTSTGVSPISQESPMFQQIAKVGAIVAAGMVGIADIGNAAGHIFWAWILESGHTSAKERM